jgi:hypothetical protein
MNEEQAMPMNQIREKLGLSYSYFSAIKKAMGLTGSHMGRMEQFNQFFKDNPNFRFTDVYHASGCDCTECGARREKRRLKKLAATPVEN